MFVVSVFDRVAGWQVEWHGPFIGREAAMTWARDMRARFARDGEDRFKVEVKEMGAES